MYSNKQLDMLISNENNGTKTYVKYYLDTKQIRPPNLDEIIEDLFLVENVLNPADTLTIIVDGEPNDTIISRIEYLFNTNGTFVVIHNLSRLQFNMLEHKLVPPTRILSGGETDQLLKTHNLKDTTQLPEISRFDAQALALAMRPGQVCEIERDSATALKCKYYRVCV
jgi:DNA-directed RNA polymerase subunit H